MKEGLGRRERWLEIVAAALISTAAVTTAWCAYQSAEWSGEQAFLLGEYNRAGRESALYETLAAQKRSLDVAIFMEWVGGIATDNEPLTEFYAERFPPNLAVAVEAWLATDPRTNPDAPAHPFAMPEYKVPEDSVVVRATSEAHTKWQEARTADENGDRYVLLTVIFASVLFFGGIEQKFSDHKVRVAFLIIGSALFIGGIAALLTYPIHLG